MPDFLSITEARTRLGGLVRHVARTRRDRVTITVNGLPAAVLVNPRELADLEATLAWHRTRRTAGAPAAAPDAPA
ncbi:type II toxin-antitoxin system prevent-host-death family antitoxin [Kitasatospora cineracea]|uniref:Antitoxin n=1 Tax=Kitasatospora cineracea TaxID=88074 RepID=A0A3N4RL81_9ACTN|nr:type II toxin-antitoxin system prevent-host-death family antitoxin [Kitasatospora cineracea]ROR43760.1 prevent-host-death family protein [Kitasatospora cineracea]RPE34103.1 prevent-host-death family protein [Kitasatospora cineracea]